MNKVFGYILGFLASIILVLLTVLLVLKISVFNKNYVLKELESSNYYEKVYDEIYEDMKNSLLSSGLDESVVENLYSKSDVKSDIRNFVGSIYSGSKFKVSTKEIEKKLNRNIDKYLASKNIVLQDKSALSSYVSDIASVYSEEVGLYGYFQNYSGMFLKISNIINFVIPFLVMIFVLIFILDFYKFKTKFLGVSMFASSMMILYLKYFIWNKIDYNNILIISESFSGVLRRVLSHINSYLLYFVLGYFVLGLILILKNSWIKKRRRKRRLS